MNPLASRRRRSLHTAVLAALAMAGLSLHTGCDPADGDASTQTSAPISDVQSNVPAAFVVHHARTGKAELRTPASWKETSTAGTVVLNLKTDRPGSSVSLVEVPTASGETLVKTMTHMPEQLGTELANFHHIRTDYLVLNELPAGRIVYEAARNGFTGKLVQVFIMKGGRTYIFTYTAAPSVYEQEYPLAEAVLASWRIP